VRVSAGLEDKEVQELQLRQGTDRGRGVSQNKCTVCGAYIPDKPTLCERCGCRRQQRIAREREKEEEEDELSRG